GGPAGEVRTDLSVHRPRSVRGAPPVPARGGDVSRAHRGTGRRRYAVRQPDASVHPGASRRGSGAGSLGGTGPGFSPGEGRGAKPDQPAVRLRVPSALPDGG